MLTTDPIYYKPLLPHLSINNTSNTTALYTYNPFTNTSTTDVPLYASVSLSQNTHGEFMIQFEDENKSMENAGITVGCRVKILAGKQNPASSILISGLVRRKGYSRGENRKVLYTISGSSTGIRLNERVIYVVSEALKTSTGAIDYTDTTRKADALLATNLNSLTSDGILSIANLAA